MIGQLGLGQAGGWLVGLWLVENQLVTQHLVWWSGGLSTGFWTGPGSGLVQVWLRVWIRAWVTRGNVSLMTDRLVLVRRAPEWFWSGGPLTGSGPAGP